MRNPRHIAVFAAVALLGACSRAEISPSAGKAANPNVVVVSEAEARFNEGKRLLEKNATGQDLADAVSMLLRSAELGKPDAQVLLAKLYQDGRGLPRNPGQAVNLLLVAREKGNAVAAYELGKAFETGNGVEKNPGEAMNNYLRAAQARNRDAMFEVAKAFESGHGVPANKVEAVAWYLKAVEAGHPEAAHRLKALDVR
jgi:TPR repeat protein